MPSRCVGGDSALLTDACVTAFLSSSSSELEDCWGCCCWWCCTADSRPVRADESVYMTSAGCGLEDFRGAKIEANASGVVTTGIEDTTDKGRWRENNDARLTSLGVKCCVDGTLGRLSFKSSFTLWDVPSAVSFGLLFPIRPSARFSASSFVPGATSLPGTCVAVSIFLDPSLGGAGGLEDECRR